MRSAGESARVLHVNDAADTARNLTTAARAAGQRWDLFAKASARTDWSGPVAKAQRAAVGGLWVARLAVAARRHDIVHVHSASTVQHSQYATKRYVVHCHGTDVRTAQYRYPDGGVIRHALREAEAVLYSTPDLAEHVLPYRGDAELLPVPLLLDRVPRWSGRRRSVPRIAFASRWGDEKNAPLQLECARALIAALGPDVEVAGLDWGEHAGRAKDLGVRLYPRMAHADYVRWLAESTAVVGQAAGILSASELEGLGSGAPFALPVPLLGNESEPPPVIGDSVESVVAGLRAVIADPDGHDPDPGRGWVDAHHDARHGVAQLNRIYTEVLDRR